MDINEIISKVDHTLLSQTATLSQIQNLCDEGMKYKVASVCIPPSYVNFAKNHVENRLKVCTVVGFPDGYSTTASKVFETEDALNNGANEIDMVINLGWVKDALYKNVESEIREIKRVCGTKILKVIIETCLLTSEEKVNMCKVVTNSGADFIKTSTGFSTSGATIENINLFAKHIGKNLKIKAAGGIGSLEMAKKFVEAGAERLGTSKIIKFIV